MSVREAGLWGKDMATKTEITDAEKRFNSMKTEYDSNGWKSSHMDLRDYIEPSRGHFDSDEANDGKMIDHQKVLDGYATIANNVLSSGLMSGMTSPNRPWSKYEIDGFEGDQEVNIWLDDLDVKVRSIFNVSNLYETLFGIYKELGSVCTGCFIVLEDFEEGIRCHSFTAGEYYLGKDNRGKITSFAREYFMTVSQLVEEFGMDSVSGSVVADFKNNQKEKHYKVRHLIEKGRAPNGMPYRSLYWEAGNHSNGFLAKRGFNRFPVIAPRWETTTTHQIYGKGPGWNALGDIKQLQKTIDDKLKIQEKLHNPPTVSDADIEGFPNLLPGGNTKSSFNVPDAGVRAAYTVPDALNSFIEMENHLKENIDKFFFVNLFLMLLAVDKNNMTATEIAERQQEKIMMMGPILHKLKEELLDPLHDIVFGYLWDASVDLWGTEREIFAPLRPPPPQLQGVDIKVKYISILAQAQEALGVQQIQRVMETVTAISQFRPDILDNYNYDEIARQVSEMEGTPAKIMLGTDEVDGVRQQRQQVQAAQQLAEIGKDGSTALRNVAKAQADAENTGG